MVDLAATSRPADIPTRAVFVFFGLTFAITWSLIGLYVLLPTWAATTFGPISGRHPFFFLATWAPAISAFALVLFHGGWTGLRAFLSRLFLWRCPALWVGFILIGLPLLYMAGSLLKDGPLLASVPPEGWGALWAGLGIMLFLGPVEEFGWRGIAQPLLQRHLAPIWAGMIIGTIWGVWHLPAFFLSGTVFAGWSFLPFLIGNIALAVLVTPLFNQTGGSLLWPMLFHWQLINPFWPDAQPYDTWLLVDVTAGVVFCCRKDLFRRSGAVTKVLSGSSDNSTD